MMNCYRSNEIISSVVGNPAAEETPYTKYRIPGIVVSRKGTVLVYWECRREDNNRKGNNPDECLMDLYVRRSEDNGESFGEPIAIARGEEYFQNGYGETVNNPVMFAAKNGSLHLLFCCDVGRGGVWHTVSTDDGITWSKPRNIVNSLKRYPWELIGLGPGHGICLKNGRMIVSAWIFGKELPNNISNMFPSRVTTVYSDDNGETWRMGELISNNSDETSIVELSDGSVMVNSRQYSLPYCEAKPERTAEEAYRTVSVSKNGTDGWTETAFDKTLIDPACEGNICSAELNGFPRVILFVNCASKTKRWDLTVRCSFDDAKTWSDKTLKLDGVGWYSDIAVDARGCVYVLHEDNSVPSADGRMCMELFRFSLYDNFINP